MITIPPICIPCTPLLDVPPVDPTVLYPVGTCIVPLRLRFLPPLSTHVPCLLSASMVWDTSTCEITPLASTSIDSAVRIESHDSVMSMPLSHNPNISISVEISNDRYISISYHRLVNGIWKPMSGLNSRFMVECENKQHRVTYIDTFDNDVIIFTTEGKAIFCRYMELPRVVHNIPYGVDSVVPLPSEDKDRDIINAVCKYHTKLPIVLIGVVASYCLITQGRCEAITTHQPMQSSPDEFTSMIVRQLNSRYHP